MLTLSREDLFFPLQKQIDKMFDEFFGPKRLPSVLNSVKSHSGYPKLDILVTDGKYRIEVALPGCNSSDVKVDIIPGEATKRCVRISGKMSRDYQYASEMDFHVRELTRAKFQRIIGLPDEVENEPEAKLSNGMLVLTWEFSKKENPKIVNVPVKDTV